MGMKTSTVVKITPQESKTSNSNENEELGEVEQRDTEKVLEKKVKQQSKELKNLETAIKTMGTEVIKEETKNPETVIVSHTPNTKIHPPVETSRKEPVILPSKGGKEKTVVKQKLPQKPSRVVVDVKKRKDKTDGQKKWETDLTVEGKPKTSTNPDTVIKEVETGPEEIVEVESAKPGQTEILDIEPSPVVTEEKLAVNPLTGKTKVVDVVQSADKVVEVDSNKDEVVDVEDEVVEVDSKKDEVVEVEDKVVEVDSKKGVEVDEVKAAGPGVEVIEVKPDGSEKMKVLEPAKTAAGVTVVEPTDDDEMEIVKTEKVSSNVIDMDNLGKKTKVVAAVEEDRVAILNEIAEGLNPNLVRWAEQAIAAGIENIVNAVEDKYIKYVTMLKNKQRRKRAAPKARVRKRRQGNKKTLTHAIKKVQKAAAKLAANEAQTAAEQASSAAKLNMDVTNEVANNALKSVASAITDASQGAARKIVHAENVAAAEALAGAAVVAPVLASAGPPATVVAIEPPPSPVSLDQLAAGGGAGKDLIQQTLQIQKGLNLVMRAVLKEKERVAADLARYQNKISFLLREMAGAPVEVVETAIKKTPVEVVVEKNRRRREIRRKQRAAVSAAHLQQVLEREESKLNAMLNMLDVTLSGQNQLKRKRESAGGVCKRHGERSRTGHLTRCA